MAKIGVYIQHTTDNKYILRDYIMARKRSVITTQFRVPIDDSIVQGSSNLGREIHFPAEFSSNPNQTHLSMLINVCRIIRKSQVGEFDQDWC